jgi:hypothetical protein
MLREAHLQRDSVGLRIDLFVQEGRPLLGRYRKNLGRHFLDPFDAVVP